MKKLTFIILMLIQTGALLFTACGRMGPVPPPDKTAPTVNGTIPTDGYQNWPINGYITMTFTKDMDPTTLNPQTVVLTDQNGNSQALSVTYATNGTNTYVAVVKPTQDLQQAMIYTVNVSTGVKDIYGIAMVTPVRFFFITQKLLSVQSTTPVKDAVNVPTNSSINVLFSKAIDPSTIVFNLFSTSSGTVPYTMDFTLNPNISFIPTPTPGIAPLGLISNTTYTARVSSGLKDFAGDVLTDDYVWSFTTGTNTDITPPYVQATDPANGSSNVPVYPLIIVTFSEAVRTTPTTTLTLYSAGTGTITCVRTNELPTQYMYNLPTSINNLAYGTQFKATLTAGVEDLAGNPMPAPYSWNFTTLMPATQTTVNAPAVAYGADGSVTVSVAASGTGLTPTGNVSLSVDNGTALFKPLNSGSATFTISSPSAGNHSLLASYPTQSIFLSSSATGTLSVGLSTTSTAVTSSANPSAYGSSVTFTATVTPSTANGTVTFKDGATTLGTGNLSGGTATYSTSSLALGSHSITAAYAGNANFGASTSPALTQTVNQTATTMSISAPAVTYNANGVVTVSVTSGGPAVTGNVTLSVDGGAATTLPLSNGSASFTITSPSVGSHTLSASYAQQGNFGASSASGSLSVNPAPTSTSISAPAIAYGANGTVTVTVSSSGTLIPTGNVTLSVDSGTPMLGSVTGTGTATFTITTPTLGNHYLLATYAAQGNFGGSQASGYLSVGSASTTTTITPPATVTYGANGSVTVTVSSGAGTPTGSVSLAVDSTTLPSQGLINGSTTFAVASPSSGSHTLSASYAPQGSFGASSGTGTLSVNKAVLTVTANNASKVFNTANPVFSASYSGFVNGDTSAVLSGAPSLTTTATTSSPVGSYPITAAVGSLAAANYTFSFVNGTLTVTLATSSTSVTPSANPSAFGGSVTFTATVSPATATGTVTFIDGGLAIGSGTLSGGATTFSTTALAVGTHSITAVYGGDANYATSTSGALSQVVNKASTTTGVVSSANPSSFGGSVTFTATVSPVTATGTVTFMDGASAIGSGTLSGGATTYTTTALTIGTHTITAVYGGDATYATSTSGALSQVVNKASSSTSVTSSANPSAFGGSVTFTATVSPATATGTVTFLDGGLAIGSGTLSGGATTYTTTTLTIGTHTITAVYGGDANYTTSTSGALSQVVNKASTTTGVVSSANPSSFGGSVTFTATVSPATATGTVTFKDGASTIGSGTLSGGATTYTTTALTIGTHTITAVYGGDTNYTTSTSGVLSQVVNNSSSSTSVTSSANPSAFGGTVTFTATVSPATATGTVTFKDGAATIGSGTLVGGATTYTTTTLTIGTHTITAVYGGDTTYAGSTSAVLSQDVNKASTTTVVASSANPSTYGGSVTFTATVSPSTATGLVTFKDGSTAIGSASLSGGTASISTSTLSATAHAITAVYGGDANYLTSTSDPMVQNVNKAVLTVTAGNASRVYGAANPTFTSSYSGFVNGESSSVLSGSPSLTTTANATSPAGSYAITAAQGTLTATNYSFSFVNGTLTVTQASTTTTVTGPSSPQQAGALTFTATVTGSAATGTVTFSESTLGALCSGPVSGGTASCVANVAASTGPGYTITATYSGDTNYSGSTSPPYTLNVN